MRSTLACLCLMLTTQTALGCEPPVIMIGADGQAEYISPTRDLSADLEAMFGAAPVAGSTMVIDARDRSGRWMPPGSDLTPMEIAVLFGGETASGFRYSGPEHCAPPDLPLALPPGPDQLPEDLFPDEAAAGPQPRSGQWQARLGQTQLQDCPKMIAQAFPQSPGALPEEWLSPRALAFFAPFHPDQLALSRTLAGQGLGSVTWRPAGPGSWQAEVAPELFSRMPADEGAGSKMIWTLTVTSPELINHSVALNVVFPAAAAQILGSKSCTMTTDNQWLRIGD